MKPSPVRAYDFRFITQMNPQERFTIKEFRSIGEASRFYQKPYKVFAPQINRAISFNWRACGVMWERAN